MKKTITSSVQRMALCLILSFALVALMSSSTYASNTNTPVDSPIGRILCSVIMMMWGNLGRGLACLAVISLGVGAMMGKLSWGLAMTVATGIGVLFGAADIVKYFLLATGDAVLNGTIGCGGVVYNNITGPA